MPDYAFARVAAGDPMPGLLVVDDWLGVGRAVDDLLLIAECMTRPELDGRVVYIPL